MKKTNRTKRIAFGLAVILLVLQLFGHGTVWQAMRTEQVARAAEPTDTASIAVTGPCIQVDPALVMSAVETASVSRDSVVYQWAAVPGATGYMIYMYNELTSEYELVAETDQTSYTVSGMASGEECYLAVYAVNADLGTRSDFAAPALAYTVPERLDSFTISDNTTTSVTLRWTDVQSATGYIIYRAGTGGNFKKLGTTTYAEYKDETLEAGKTYQYKIVTYAGTEDNVGEESPAIFTSSLPAAPVVTIKGGNQRVRLNWAAITGAEGYHVYQYQAEQYVLVTTLEGKASKQFIHTGLENDVEVQYAVTAYRTYNGAVYESAMSGAATATPAEVDPTSTEAKLFGTLSEFKRSAAYTKNADFKKKVKYAKSFPIPGMVNTNVAEFACTTMIPQGITAAKSCFFITAYDSKGVENSVIYVVKKSSKELLTTIVLPNKAHAGGIAFDGKNLWITQSQTLKSIPYSEVEDAVDNEDPYVELAAYGSEVDLPQQAATVTYYKKLLWVSSYDELNPGYLVSYKISSKSSAPTLTALNTIKMPTRVQGIAFSSNGRLIVSRSCQTDSKQRGFLHQIDVYKPNLKKASKGIISLGSVRNTVIMPTMNEEIAVSGSLLYVNFESVSFSKAVMRMDRVCALPVSFVTKLKKK